MSELYQRSIEVNIAGLEIRGLNVEFSVEMDLTPAPDKGALTVYGLSKDSRGKIEEAVGTDKVVQLSVGYNDRPSLIYEGTVRRVTHERQGGDVATSVEATSGLLPRNYGVQLNKPYGKNTALRTVFGDLADALGIGRGNLDKVIGEADLGGTAQTFENGVTLSGPAWDSLVDLADSSGYSLTVQNGALLLLAYADSVGDVAVRRPAIRVAPGTGMVGSPSLDAKGLLSVACKPVPGLLPGVLIDVESEFVSGTFKVLRATYEGSLFGDLFDVQLEGRAA